MCKTDNGGGGGGGGGKNVSKIDCVICKRPLINNKYIRIQYYFSILHFFDERGEKH